uniref:Truncated transposase n=1 Tax=Rhizobium loti TaxID=381 RepID=M5ALP0_RHILI|nr:truncated transposase [Mesorhizobium loti NZP2037]
MKATKPCGISSAPGAACERLHAQARTYLSAQKGLDDALSLAAGAAVPSSHQIALQEIVEAVRISKERAERLECVIEEFVPAWSLAPIVRACRHNVVWI